MSISGQQNINIGLPNEATNSDSLFTAFTKTKDNFATLFACSSPYSTFTAGPGISVDANANVGSITISSTGVSDVIAGTNINVSRENGNVIISTDTGNIVSVNLDGNVSNVLSGNGTFIPKTEIDANTLVWTNAPASNTDSGVAGEVAYDIDGNFYICVSENTWSKISGTIDW